MTMKQVWVNAATWSCTPATTAGAALPTVVTAIPEPKSMKLLPSTSTTTPPPARSTYTGSDEPTPADTAAERRACSACERGPGIAVLTMRCCGSGGTDIGCLSSADVGWWIGFEIEGPRGGPAFKT